MKQWFHTLVYSLRVYYSDFLKSTLIELCLMMAAPILDGEYLAFFSCLTKKIFFGDWPCNPLAPILQEYMPRKLFLLSCCWLVVYNFKELYHVIGLSHKPLFSYLFYLRGHSRLYISSGWLDYRLVISPVFGNTVVYIIIQNTFTSTAAPWFAI